MSGSQRVSSEVSRDSIVNIDNGYAQTRVTVTVAKELEYEVNHTGDGELVIETWREA